MLNNIRIGMRVKTIVDSSKGFYKRGYNGVVVDYGMNGVEVLFDKDTRSGLCSGLNPKDLEELPSLCKDDIKHGMLVVLRCNSYGVVFKNYAKVGYPVIHLNEGSVLNIDSFDINLRYQSNNIIPNELDIMEVFEFNGSKLLTRLWKREIEDDLKIVELANKVHNLDKQISERNILITEAKHQLTKLLKERGE